MINRILIAGLIVSGVAHNSDIRPDVNFWIFELCFLAVLWHNRQLILNWILENQV